MIIMKSICKRLCDFINSPFNLQSKAQSNQPIPSLETTKHIPLLEMNNNRTESFFNNNSHTFQGKEFPNHITLKDFKIIKTLGKGSFGKVILVYNEELRKYFAMKTLKKDFIKQHQQIAHTKTERTILEQVSHPFLIKLYYAFQNNEKLYMITDYMSGGEMFYHLHKEEYFTEERTRLYICELLLALGYLHSHNIIYRDLKPENILLDEEGHLKIADFGLSKILTESNVEGRTFTKCGTPEYLAPEVFIGNGYDKSIDWWSLGIVLYEFLVGYSPYREAKHGFNISMYQKPLFRDQLISDEAFDLILKLLHIDPSKRLGSGVRDAEEIKDHHFFKGINWEDISNKSIKPDFVPRVKHAADVSNFDKMFTEENPNSYLDTKNKLIKTCEPQSPYENFTYRNTLLKK